MGITHVISYRRIAQMRLEPQALLEAAGIEHRLEVAASASAYADKG
jgi:hypothetical protein